MDRRRMIRSALIAVAFVATVAATLAIYVQDRLLDADDFGATVAASLSDPDVNEYLAHGLAEQLVERAPSVAVAGPLIEGAAADLIGSGAASRIVETGAASAHRTVFAGDDESTFLLELSDLVVLVEGQVRAVAPDVADRFPGSVSGLAVEVSGGQAFADAVGLARALRRLTLALVVVAGAALVGVAVADRDRWRGLQAMGLTLGAAGVAVAVAEAVGRALIVGWASGRAEAAAVAGLWSTVAGGLRSWAWLLVGMGAVVAGLAWSVSAAARADAMAPDPDESGNAHDQDQARSSALTKAGSRVMLGATEPLRSPSELIGAPTTTGGRMLRAIGLACVAGWAVIDPSSAASGVVRLAGLALGVVAVGELGRIVGIDRALAKRSPLSGDRGGSTRRAVLPFAIVLAIGVLGSWMLAPRSSPTPALMDIAVEECNGSAEWCGRRLDQVTLAASHNSMSSPETGFLLPNQTNTIVEQLDDGIRGLMIDTWYGRPAGNGIIVTTRGGQGADPADEATLAAVEAARARAGQDLGDQAVYLCHTFCEVGAVDAVEALTEIRQWLVINPHEVLVIIVQDATAPADTAAAFRAAGLERYAMTQEPGESFPTLAEMIESDRRLFVMVEEDPGDIAWLHPAFEFSQETPYSFGAVEDFSCAENRGPADAPLFVVNHFLTPAVATNRDINDLALVEERLAQCATERGRLPNLIAADFVESGDLVAAAQAAPG